MYKKIIKVIDLLIVIGVTAGVFINLANATTSYGRWHLFIYYTIQSNILVLCIASLHLLADRVPNIYYKMRTGLTLNITLTGLAYHFMLSQIHTPYGTGRWSNALLHYIVPILTVVNWFLLIRSVKIKFKFAFYGLIFPAVYLVGSMIRGAVTEDYPYWFLRPVGNYPDGIGSYFNVFMVSILLSIASLLLGLIFIAIANYSQNLIIQNKDK